MFGIVEIKMMEMPRKLLQKCPRCKRVLMTSGNKLWVKLVMSGNKWMVVIMRFYMEKEGTKSQEASDAPRRMMCEICGYNNHSAYDCKRCGL